jgi:alpha-beta hydrolase superfamily lysophospholipase
MTIGTVITLAGRGQTGTPVMRDWYKGFATASGRKWVNLTYSEPTDGVWADAVAALDAAINDSGNPHDIVVLGHSMGSQIAGQWIRTHMADPTNKAAWLSFILTGNPDRRLGRIWGWNVNRPTLSVEGRTIYVPEDSPYTIRDVTRVNDGWANWPGKDNPWNYMVTTDLGKIIEALVNWFTGHGDYSQVDLDTLAADCIDSPITAGNTTYYTVTGS